MKLLNYNIDDNSEITRPIVDVLEHYYKLLTLNLCKNRDNETSIMHRMACYIEQLLIKVDIQIDGKINYSKNKLLHNLKKGINHISHLY